MIQINISGEDTKSGIEANELGDLIYDCQCLKNIKIIGLMTIGLHTEDVEKIRENFKKMKVLYDNHNGGHFKYLSMGMSDDYQIAIEEGSNMVRIGRAIFGERD